MQFSGFKSKLSKMHILNLSKISILDKLKSTYFLRFV